MARVVPAGAMAALRQGSWPLHQQLDKRLASQRRFTDIAHYREHLARLWAFHVAAEDAWAPWLVPALGDFEARRKAPWLQRDIAVLGGAAASGALPPVPAVDDTACALGAFYVLEGATLGGQHLLPLVLRMGVTPGQGGCYLASYGAEVGLMWQRFGAAVEAHCQTPQSTGRAVAAAQRTFAALEHCLCGALHADP